MFRALFWCVGALISYWTVLQGPVFSLFWKRGFAPFGNVEDIGWAILLRRGMRNSPRTFRYRLTGFAAAKFDHILAGMNPIGES
jgi:hypothetical protein